MAERPNIFDYSNYRHFLNDLVTFMRATGGYSNEKFRKKSGFGSPAQVRMVMQGKRNLSDRAAQQMATAFELSKPETKYFSALVSFAQSSDAEAQEEAYKKVLRLKGLSKSRHIAPFEYEYFSNWINVAVAEAVSSRWANASDKEIADLLKVKVSDVKESLKLLQKLGFIQWNEEKKSWDRKSGPLFTDPDTKSLQLRAFHREMTKHALSKLDDLDETKRHLLGLTICLSEKDYETVCKRLFEILRELNADFSSSQDARAVYQLNLQLFPLSQI